ncbi:MAG: hypothetical protein VST69_06175, partial [Nitrospirota bacterium]|nr:hypothetical protein [Nitrospirota bacterium]
MKTQTCKAEENKSSKVHNGKSSSRQGFGFVDNRSQAVGQRKAQNIINNSPRMIAQRQQFFDNRSEAIAQRKIEEMINSECRKYIELKSERSQTEMSGLIEPQTSQLKSSTLQLGKGKNKKFKNKSKEFIGGKDNNTHVHEYSNGGGHLKVNGKKYD